jgi:hypothetical protein
MSHHRSENPDVINELDEVVLTCDIPHHGLTAGDIGTVVLVHGEGKGFEVEFMTLDGETIAVATLRADQVRAVQHDEIAHARLLISQTNVHLKP